jgi:hypothetical protein
MADSKIRVTTLQVILWAGSGTIFVALKWLI